MTYKFLRPDDPILKNKLEKVSFDTFEEMYHLTPAQLYNNLFETMTECGGIGLSANQCGVMVRMFVMYTDWDNKVHEAMFNPEIIWESDNQIVFSEGCLTYPFLFLDINRPYEIEVKYQDIEGIEYQKKLSGIPARVFQHEYDHMEGKNFTQLVSPLKLDIAKRKAAKTLKKEKIKQKNARNT